jgi:hypothetical protein
MIAANAPDVDPDKKLTVASSELELSLALSTPCTKGAYTFLFTVSKLIQ